jgi:FkbM family methyltransferase
MLPARTHIRRLINRAGFDLHRLSPQSSPDAQLFAALNSVQVDLVLDVGANVGQFAVRLRSVGYAGRLVSFEPLEEEWQALCRAAAGDALWQVHPRGAVGDYDGATQINVAGNSVSSSLLPMLEAHSTAARESSYVGAQQVQIFRLDSVAGPYLQGAARPFLKIDAQGYEWQILDGAAATLPRMQGLLCELSLVSLYEGQRLWLEMIERLAGAGFTLWSIQDGFVDPRDGRTLQVNAIFLRR